MGQLKYPVIVQPLPLEEGGGFVATAPDLPGCMSDGETPEEALANVPDAIAVWLEAAHEMGRKCRNLPRSWPWRVKPRKSFASGDRERRPSPSHAAYASWAPTLSPLRRERE